MRRIALGMFVAASCTLPGLAWAQAPSRELLLFMTVPTVVTPTLRPQPITRAPSTITVITAEEIRLSGATTIADLLRSVPGLDVMRVSASDINVAGRGLNERGANRIQVFVDGRPVLEDFFNFVFWEQLPVSLEEIDRIEVVTGPASALFGTNAFSGVVQIITKSPDALRGTHLVGRAGTAGADAGTLIHADTAGPVGYKLVLEYDRVNHFPNPLVGRTDDQKGREDTRGAGLVELRPRRDILVSIAGGADRFDRDIDSGIGSSVQPGLGRFFARGTTGFGKLNYAQGDLKAQVVFSRFDTGLQSLLLPPGGGGAVVDTIQADLQHSLPLGRQHVLTAGASHRFNRLEAPVLVGAEAREQHLVAAFLQDEFSPRPDLTFTLGLRVDRHPDAGVNVSPRGSVVYEPSQRHALRASVGTAFRNPSLVENFFALTIPTEVQDPPAFRVEGNRGLVSEELIAYEAGYRGAWFDRVKVRLDLFYNDFGRFIQLAQGGPGTFAFANLPGGFGYGGEVGVEAFLTDWLRALANYSYQEMRAETSVLGLAPHHKANAGLFATFRNGVSASLIVHLVGEAETISLPFPGAPVPIRAAPYAQVDARLAYRFALFGAEAEAALAAANVFNDPHREIPGGDRITRRVTGTLRIRF
jgi:iron complex outermembrane receptor protein